MRTWILALLAVLVLPACASAQTQDTLRIPVPYDTAWTIPADTAFKSDTVITVDTIITPARDTVATLCCRDSLVITPKPPVSVAHPKEPAGFVRFAEHDFATPLAKNWKGLAGQAGCWETNGGTVINGGKYVVTYPVAFADGRTPATLHAMSACQNPKGFSQVYIHMIGFVPGDNGTPMWNNGEGNKMLFWHFGTGSGTPILKCWDYPAGSVGGIRSDCTVNADAQGVWLGARSAKIYAGQPNDIECVITLNTPGTANGSIVCWINGVQAGWINKTLRTSASSLVTELWLDWTYGGGGAGVAVGQRSVWTLSGFYASGR